MLPSINYLINLINRQWSELAFSYNIQSKTPFVVIAIIKVYLTKTLLSFVVLFNRLPIISLPLLENKSNNNIDNLEWITFEDNVIHGCSRKISKINKDTNEVIKKYSNIRQAYKELNKPWNSLISKVCNKEKGRKNNLWF